MTYCSDPTRLDDAGLGEILRCEVGSTLHGTGLPGMEDLDLMGITVMPKWDVLGMNPMETVVWRSADNGQRSTKDDTDLSIYALTKYLRLASAGNPSILLPLWAPENKLVYVDDVGRYLRSRATLFVSKAAGYRFAGYMRAQRERMVGAHDGTRAPRSNRPELVETYGYDTKFAMHMLRLGYQGIELMETGGITLPITGLTRTVLVKARTGGYTYEEILELADAAAQDLDQAITTADCPPRPDPARVNHLSVRLHDWAWTR